MLAIGVDEPHITSLTRPWATAAFSSAGAVSGVKSRMTAPPLPAACTSLRMVEFASVTGSCVGKILTGTPSFFPSAATPLSAYAEIVDGEAIAIDFAPAAMSACAAPTLL